VDVWTSDLQDIFHLDGLHTHGGKGQEDLALPDDGQQLWVAFRAAPQLCVWELKNSQEFALHTEIFWDDIYSKHYSQQHIPKPLHTFELGQQGSHLAFSPDEALVAVGLLDELLLIDRKSYQVVHRWKVPLGDEPYRRSPVGRLCFSRDGRLLSSMTGWGGIWVWSVPDLV
jgi:hypothetical protein